MRNKKPRSDAPALSATMHFPAAEPGKGRSAEQDRKPPSSIESLATEIRKILGNAGAALVGFANIEGLTGANFPVGISVAVPLPPEIVHEIAEKPTAAYAQAYRDLNEQLDAIVLAGERFLAERGYNACALTKSRVSETRIDRYQTQLPHKTMARLAGLGWIGKSCLLVTPQYGPAVRISTLLTDAPLPCATPIAESRCGSCMQCANACPGHAIKGVLWHEGSNRSDRLDLEACVAHMEQVSHGLEEDLICGACIAACPYAQRWRATASRPPQLALHGLQ